MRPPPHAALLLLLASSCATLPAPLPLGRAAQDAPALDRAAEDFYRATTLADLDAALDRARTAGEASARYRELAALRQWLDGREDLAVEHLAAALQDTSSDVPLLHLSLLLRLDWPLAAWPRLEALLDGLARAHPSEEVRSAAAYHLASVRGAAGDFAGRDARLAAVTGRLRFDVVGSWDNEAGKAFDQDLDPEERPGLDQQYEVRGNRREAWRRAPPLDHRGRVDFAALVYPSRDSAAFAQAVFAVPADGGYALRLTTTDPLKVWVDDRLVFSAVQVEAATFDHVRVPLVLKAGVHRVLVKSAHRDGSWTLLGRVTPEPTGGSPAPSLEQVLLARALQVASPLRRAWAMTAWAQVGSGGNLWVQSADAFARAAPRGILATTALVDALWFNQERGRAADLLAEADRRLGDGLPFVRLRQLRFLQQQGLKQRARDGLVALTAKRPDLLEAKDLLADLFKDEGWTEDEVRVLREVAAAPQAQVGARTRLAAALGRLGRKEEARAVLAELLRLQPGNGDAARALAEQHLQEGRLEAAVRAQEARLRAWPTDLGGHQALAELARRRGDRAAAEEALQRALALCPEHAPTWSLWGALAWEAGDKDAAVAHWRRSLEANPDDDRLALRLDFVSPEKKGPWAAEVPDDAGLDRVVALRDKLRPLPGADLVYLLDHEVTQLGSDGSTVNVITLVMHAFNPAGRDRMTRQTLLGHGRRRVLHAWAVDEKGRRSEASSERGGQVFFRGLTVGSTTVLQYRVDSPPSGYLARYLSKHWTFQGTSDQRVLARFVLWAPRSTKLHEQRVGDLKRTEEVRGEQLRVEWSLGEVGPLVAEPSMPPVVELGANLRVSTVPGWEHVLSWERALLEGAFRKSPELEAVAKKLGEDADAAERVLRVHQYVMEEVRYQQDYESFLAGVKPHPAPMVLERRYGDCKDKAVLFITLARELGLDAHFALVRTRDQGPTNPDVPGQQFNHAIVWVPAQAGIPEGRFFDPTADALDLDTVRQDDVGTKALVFDPKSAEHTWRDIPFQGPEAHAEQLAIDVALDGAGRGEGVFTLKGQGSFGSDIRRGARNKELVAQVLQRLGSQLMPGATVQDVALDEVKDLRRPAQLSARLTWPTAARAEGNQLRVRIPSEWSPRAAFGLAARRHPLVLGAPRTLASRITVKLPEGLQVSRLPLGTKVDLPCFEYERRARQDGDAVVVEQTVRTKCERISAEEYPRYRKATEEIGRLLDDELVLGPSAPPAKKPAKAPAAP